MKLTAQIREGAGSHRARTLRKNGRIPATLYGNSDPASLSLEADAVNALIGSGERVVSIDVDGKSEQALLKDVQFDIYGMDVVHLDLQRVTDDQVVTTKVPLEFFGTPIGTIVGGVVEHHLVDLKVSGPASKIPSKVVVKIEHLELAKTLLVGEIELPEGVKPAARVDLRGPVVTIRALKKRGGGKKDAEAEAEEAAKA